MSNYGAKRQAETRPTATRHGNGWSLADVALVCRENGPDAVPLAALALAFGRTYFAVQSVRNDALNGRPVGGGASRVGRPNDGRGGRPYVGWMEGDDDA